MTTLLDHAPTPLPTLPLITSRPALPTTLCDSCEGETPATRELNYTVRTGTPDQAGRALAVCDLAACKAIAMSYIEKVGDYIETDRYDGRPEA